MELKRARLNQAVDAGVVTQDQANALWEFLSITSSDSPSFQPAHILYYLGGGIAISAVTFFVTLAWDKWAGWPMFALAVGFGLLGVTLTHFFLYRKHLLLPAGIMITFAVATTPLAIYSVQRALGFWEGDYRSVDFHRYIDWRWILMELATLAAAAIAFWRYRMPFLLFPTSVMLWYLHMDLVSFIFDVPGRGWELRKLTSILFGFLLILFAFWVDVRSSRIKDYSFWLYLFGVLTFWCGLTLLDSDSELGKFVYFCVNIGLLVVGTLLSRSVFAVFAAFGILAYLGHLSRELFEDSLIFPVALASIGIGVVFLGVLWKRHEKSLNARILGLLPDPVRRLVEHAHQ